MVVVSFPWCRFHGEGTVVGGRRGAVEGSEGGNTNAWVSPQWNVSVVFLGRRGGKEEGEEEGQE